MSAHIVDTDRGLKARVRDLSAKWRTRVGVLADAKARGDRITNVEVAAIHEFGAPGANIPMRSFVRETVDLKAKEIREMQRAQGRLVLEGKIDGKTAVDRIGLFVAGLMKQRIADFIPPPLSQERIEEKGSSTPLIDTGQLRSSIAHHTEQGTVTK